MWSFNRCVCITTALSSLSSVPKPNMLPLLHQAQSPYCCSTAKHREFATEEPTFLLLLTSFSIKLITLHSSIFTLFSVPWGDSKCCVGCVILCSFQKLGFEISWFFYSLIFKILNFAELSGNIAWNTPALAVIIFLSQIGIRQVARFSEAVSTCTSHLFQLKVVDMSLLFNFKVGGDIRIFYLPPSLQRQWSKICSVSAA